MPTLRPRVNKQQHGMSTVVEVTLSALSYRNFSPVKRRNLQSSRVVHISTRAQTHLEPEAVSGTSGLLRLHGPLGRGNWTVHLATRRLARSDRLSQLPSINSPDGGPCRCSPALSTIPLYRTIPRRIHHGRHEANLATCWRVDATTQTAPVYRFGAVGKRISCRLHIKDSPVPLQLLSPHHTLTYTPVFTAFTHFHDLLAYTN